MVFEADAEALKDGILVERSWNQAVVHNVTDAELAAGGALVSVPGGASADHRRAALRSGVAPGRSDQARTTLPNTARDSSSR